MKHFSAGLKVLLLLTFPVHLSSADTHSLQFLYTAVTGTDFPEFTAVGLLDGEQFVYYDSNIRKATLTTEWIQKVDPDVPDHWKSEMNQDKQEWLNHNVETAMKSFNHTKGEQHTVQKMYGCELHDDGTTRGFYLDSYDGEDFTSLDLKTETWTAAKPQAETNKHMRESGGHNTQCKAFLKYGCIETLKKFVSYGRKTLERKVRPEVSVFQNHSSSPEVVCHATGFFPKALNITWQKDGEDVHEDVELRETLPNQDGSFQKRSILKVPAEELQKHTYTCVIQHSSLEKELVLPVSERRILRGGLSDGGSDGGSGGGSGTGSGGAPISIIIGVIVALVVLVGIIAGIVVWKKKKNSL